MTRGGGAYADESWDGQYLYYVRSLSGAGIWRVPMEGGDETEVVSEPLWFGDWALSQSGIYFTKERRRARREEYTIHYLDLESGQVSELYRKGGPFAHSYLAVSPDEEWILYGEWPLRTSELMLVEGFR